MGDSTCPLCAQPLSPEWGLKDSIASANYPLSVKYSICVCYSPVRLLDASPVDFQSSSFWGPSTRWVLKVEMLGVGYKLICPWGRSWEMRVSSWLYGIGLVVRFMMRVCLLPYPGECGYFLIFPMCRSHSASFWVSLRGNCFTFGVSIGGGKVRNLLCQPLRLSLWLLF